MTAGATKVKAPTAEGAVVFTDLTGFSEFTAIRGDEAALEMLTLQERLLREAMESRGRIVKNLGDGFLLWFPSVVDAVDAALKLQEKIDELPAEDSDMPMWVRIGINYGRPILHGDDLIGHDVNVAARIVDFAQSGEVLVSQACTENLAAGLTDVYFDEVGPVVMKGIPDAVTLYRAVRP